jgi:hypothetical protein
MPKLLEVRPLSQFMLWVRYEDGAEGEVNLTDLAGRGVFKSWEEPGFFQSVTIGAQGELSWGEDIDLCPDAVYMRLTAKTPEEVFPNLKKVGVDA